MKRVFIDNNVLVDLICSRIPYVEHAQHIFAHARAGHFQLGFSALSVVNTVYISRKYGFKYEDVTDRLTKICDFADVCDLVGTDVVELLDAGWKDYEDSTQYTAARNYDADCIVTRNTKDFSKSDIPVLSPVEFLNELQYS